MSNTEERGRTIIHKMEYNAGVVASLSPVLNRLTGDTEVGDAMQRLSSLMRNTADYIEELLRERSKAGEKPLELG